MATQKDPTIFGYQNFYSTTLTGDITSGTLTIGLATVPSPTSGILIIEPDSTSAREVIFYTSKGASTITCPSDGRGWAGSTASAHLTGSAVIMASVDEYFEGLADGTLSADPARTILIPNHIVSGGAVAQSAGLTGTFSNIVFYINGQRYSGTSIANKTYTASKDTYVDITSSGGGTITVTYSEVANGATAPALAANYIRVAKVVTNGSAITSVAQTGQDGLSNSIYPTFFASLTTTHVRAQVGSTYSAPSNGSTIQLSNEIYDTLGEFNPSTYTFTATKPGLYQVIGRFWWGSAGAGTTEGCESVIVLNGSAALNSDRMNGSGDANRLIRPLVFGTFYMKAGDTIILQFSGTSGVRDIVAGNYSFLEIHRIA